jgi:hypothetical protein
MAQAGEQSRWRSAALPNPIEAATPATPPATPAIHKNLNDFNGATPATPATPILSEFTETMPPPHLGSAFSMSRFDLQGKLGLRAQQYDDRPVVGVPTPSSLYLLKIACGRCSRCGSLEIIGFFGVANATPICRGVAVRDHASAYRSMTLAGMHRPKTLARRPKTFLRSRRR